MFQYLRLAQGLKGGPQTYTRELHPALNRDRPVIGLAASDRNAVSIPSRLGGWRSADARGLHGPARHQVSGNLDDLDKYL